MKKAIENFSQAQRMINDFCIEFYDKFGFWPIIKSNINSFFIPQLALEELRLIIDEIFKKNFPDIHTDEAMLGKTRKQTPILYRHIFYKIARELGYTFKDIGRFSGFNNHATILHAVKRISNLLEVKDPEVITNYNLIKNEIHDRYGDAGNVQHDSDGKPHAQSILFPLLQKGEHKSI